MRHTVVFLIVVSSLLACCALSGCNDGGSTLPPPGPGVLAVDASATRTVGYGYLSTSFFVNITGGNPPYTAVWDFADGSDPKVGERVSHVFEIPGVYDASVNVYDTKDAELGIGGNVAHSFVEITVFNSGM